MKTIRGRRWLRTTALAACAVMLAAGAALADVMNGDFENGGADWNPNAPADWQIDFPPAGGNPDGYAAIQSPFSGLGGLGCITQTFLCGDPDEGTECTIAFDYRLDPIDAAAGTGRIKVFIDGNESVVTDLPTMGWETVSYVVPCGTHVIQLCLEVDPENNAWRACFDNVRAECTGGVANEAHNWSTIKSLYR